MDIPEQHPGVIAPIIDAHLDLAWNALGWDRDLRAPLDSINAAEASSADHHSRGNATTNFKEMRRGGIAVCLVTILCRTRTESFPAAGPPRLCLDRRSPLHTLVDGRAQLEYYHALESLGELRMLATAAELDAHWASWESNPNTAPIGAILSMEGADPILTPGDAERWWNDGLRSLNLVHYGENQYAGGTGTTRPLTDLGRELLAEMERLGIILDATHLSDESFVQALDAFSGVVLASHNNCRALVPAQRQFSDEQIRRLLERGAVIGVALDAWMLHPGWEIGKTSPEVVDLNAVADHIDHICQLAGDHRHVGIGSDLDGGFGSEQVPSGLRTIADLQKIGVLLASRGYADEAINDIFFGNWLRFFREHLP